MSQVGTKTPRTCAWVVLVMLGDSYLPGALVVARSLRDVATAHRLVCMVTKDVSAAARAKLAAAYDEVTNVEEISHAVKPFESRRQQETYAGWISRSFTKWSCLSLTAYDRVILVDADMLFVENCDELFELRAPAACYSLPYAKPWQKDRGTLNVYETLLTPPDAAGDEVRVNDVNGVRPRGAGAPRDLAHGATIPAAMIVDGLARYSFVGGGFLVLLEPDFARYMALLDLVSAAPVYGAGYHCTSGPDEISIAELYARDGVDWTHIHQRYAAIPWKPNWVAAGIRAYHFHGRKPWDMSPDEYPDLARWWAVYRHFAAAAPPTSPAAEAQDGLAADLADLRLTNDLRALIVSHTKKRGRVPDKSSKRKEIDNILERWVLAAANRTRDGGLESTRVYRASHAADPHNRKLVSELADGRLGLTRPADEVVAAMLALVDSRLALDPTGGHAVTADSERMHVGSQFATPITPRLRQLVDTDLQAAARVAVRYAAVISSGQQWGLPQAHYDYLYDNFRVRGEAFASPLNARLYSRPEVVLCSAYRDTDAAFGFRSDFFGLPSFGEINWVVNPPFIEDVMERAARRIVDALSPSVPQTFFVLLPAWRDSAAYRILADCPFLAAEVRLEPPRYHFEDPAGNRMNTAAASIYLALSTEGTETRSRLRGALEHMMR